MRKLLTLISAVGLGATGTVAASNVVSCSKAAANDLGKIKGDDLKIAIDKKENNTVDYVKTTILAKINEKVLIDKDGKEVKKDDKGILTFAATDFTFKIGDADFAFPTDLTKAFDVVVAPVTGDAATENSKALKGSATFNVTPKSDDKPAPTPEDKVFDLASIKGNDLNLSAATFGTTAKVKAQILVVIKAKAPKAAESDYTVTPTEATAGTAAAGDTYAVAAKDKDKVLKGNVTFTIVA